ncbi:MAG: thymidine phosphorylase [Clostridia bacterium]|nr:thymidine phosphorylase [Clostridia bacterium]
MRATEIIMKKRLGQELTTEEIYTFVVGATNGSFEDYQLSALLMAICLNGMTDRETVDLTMAMAYSGSILDLSAIPGAKVDKHSTGGVGDTTTLIAAPLAAACGAKVAKMSGRGLGFTGGTLDKLESIPGMRIDLSKERFIQQVKEIGIAVIGQTAELAPADKTLYALRDVTATVDSLPLVTSSILSKKIAAGCDAVVLDVKTGTGAVMPTAELSVKLAETMVRIGSLTGRRFSALVTDMNQPLGLYVGNALEVKEAVDALSGRAEGPLLDVSLQLAAQMIRTSGLAATTQEALVRLRAKLDSGEGLKKLAEMIKAQGGDPRVTQDTGLLPQAEKIIPLPAAEGGFVAAMKTSDIGYAAQALGAGRVKKTDNIDPAVGLVMKKRLGEPIEKGEPWCELHVNPGSDVEEATRMLESALAVSREPAPVPSLVHAVIE